MEKFSKQSLTINEQMELLINNWLIINDKDRAINYLKFIWYYRLSWYFKFYQGSDDKFKENTNFDNILNLYIFDKKLRLLVLDALERVESAIKSTINNEMSIVKDSHWFLERDLFNWKTVKNTRWIQEDWYSEFVNRTLTEIRNSKEEYIKKYYSRYDSPEYPPSWMMFEALSFWSVSHIFSILKSSNKKVIAKNFNLNKETLTSWLRTLTYLRNVCAHHSRLWNKHLTFTPSEIDNLTNWKSNTFFGYLHILSHFMKTINPESEWINKLESLINESSFINKEDMWFPNDFDWNIFK